MTVPGDRIATTIALRNGAVTELSRTNFTPNRIKIAELVLTDVDGGNAGTLAIVGENANLFELVDSVLYLKAGISLNHKYIDDETADDETADDETADDETADDEASDDETSDDETSDDETSDVTADDIDFSINDILSIRVQLEEDSAVGLDLSVVVSTEDGDSPDDDASIYYFFSNLAGHGATTGGDILNFKRGTDTFLLQPRSTDSAITTLDEFFSYTNGPNKTSSGDNIMLVQPNFRVISDGDGGHIFFFTGVTLHFHDAGAYANGRLARGYFTITFEEELSWEDFKRAIRIDNADGTTNENFNYGRGILHDNSALKKIFGGESLKFQVLAPLVEDENATAIAIGAGAVTNLAENTNTSARMKVADLVFTDADDGDSGSLVITGTHADMFEIIGDVLYLKAGVSLDHESVATLNFRVQLAEDSTVGVDGSISVTNVDEGDASFEVRSDGVLNALAVGDVLTVVLGTPDPDGNGVFTSQWQRSDANAANYANIAGATGTSYTVAGDDMGYALRAIVSYTDDGGNTATSATNHVAIHNAPTLSTDIAGDNAVAEDNTNDETVEGTLTFDDADDGQNQATLKVYVAAGLDASDISTEVGLGASSVEISGTYGAFVFTRTNAGAITWVYTLEHGKAETQALRHREGAVDQLAVIVYDVIGLKSSVEIITVSVVGTNDRPVLGAVTGATITDNGDSDTGSVVTPGGSLTGRFTLTDENGDEHAYEATFGGAGGPAFDTPENGYTHRIDGTYGDLFYNNTLGAYEYVRDEAEIDKLDGGDTSSDIFTIIATDDSGQNNSVSVPDNLVFNIIGANDVPTALITPSTTVVEADENQIVDIATLTFADIDTDDPNGGLTIRAFASGNSRIPNTPLYNAASPNTISAGVNLVSGAYGEFSIGRADAHGELSINYDLNEVNTNVQGLGSRQKLYEKLTVYVNDGVDTTSAQTVVITIVNADAPTLRTNIAGSNVVFEDETNDETVVGTLTFDDVDAGQDKSTLRVYVAAGDDASDASQEIGLSVSNVEILGTYGSFDLTRTSSGNTRWVYTLDNSKAETRALHQGEVVTDKLAVIIYDADGLKSGVETITVSVIGWNSRPILAVTGATITDTEGPGTDSVVTSGDLLTSRFAVTDDNGETHRFRANNAVGDSTRSDSGYNRRVDGTYGDLFYNNTTGAYEYARDEAAISGLNDGDTSSDTFTITVTEQRGANSLASSQENLVFNIIGVNDAPTSSIIDSTSGIGYTDTGTVSTLISFEDPDSGDLNSGLTIHAFASGDTTEPATPVHGIGPYTDLTTTGANSVSGTYGTFSIARNDGTNNGIGELSITYDLDEGNADVQGLSLGQALYDKLTVYVGNGDETAAAQSFVVTIEGPNQGPTLQLHQGSAGTATLTEDSGTYASSTMFLFGDRDGYDPNDGLTIRAFASGDASTPPTPAYGARLHTDLSLRTGSTTEVSGTYGKFDIDRNNDSGNGSGRLVITYILDNDHASVEALNDGDSLVEKLTLYVNDDDATSGAQSFVVTIHGANDAPTTSITSSTATVSEDETGTVSTSISFGDVDSGDPNSGLAILAFASGDTAEPTTPAYGAGSPNPISAGSNSITSTYGIFSITRNDGAGAISITYDLNEGNTDVQGLTVGEGLYDKLTIYVNDGDGTANVQSFVVTITGAYENPALSYAITSSDNDVAEGNTNDETVEGSLTFDDADDGQDKATLRVYVAAGQDASDTSTEVVVGEDASDSSVEVLGTYGSFDLTRTSLGDITWVYTLDHDKAETQALHYREGVTDQLAVIVYDADGLDSGVEIIDVDITGANDQPVLGTVIGTSVMDNGDSDTDSAVTPGDALTGRFTVTDDNTDTHTFRATFGGVGAVADTSRPDFTHSIEGNYGKLFFYGNNVLDASVAYEYVRDEAEINKLDDGDTQSDIFVITATDNRGRGNSVSASENLVFTINGANDTPTVSLTGLGATVAADESEIIDVTRLTFDDIDTSDPNSDLTIRVFASGGSTEPATPVYDDGSHTDLRDGSNSVSSTYGEFSITRNDNTGELSINYDLNEENAVVSGLSAGDRLHDKLTAYINDGDATSIQETVVVTIVKASAPTVSRGGGYYYIALEDNTNDAPIEGTLTFDDADAGQDQTTLKVYVAAGEDVSDASREVEVGEGASDFDVTVLSTYGSFNLTRTSDGDATWVYTLDNTKAETQALHSNERATDQLAVIAYDADGLKSDVEIITVTVRGVNDRPVLDAIPGAWIGDNQNSPTNSRVSYGSLAGEFTLTDDNTDTHTFRATFGEVDAIADTSRPGFTHRADGVYGDLFYDNTSAAYKYVRDEAAINRLDFGFQRRDVFKITATDNHGGHSLTSAPRNLVLNFSGSNDAPVTSISGNRATISKYERGTVSALLTFDDPDIPDTNRSLSMLVFLYSGSEMPEPSRYDYDSGRGIYPSGVTIYTSYGVFGIRRYNDTGKLSITYDLFEAGVYSPFGGAENIRDGEIKYTQLTIYISDGTSFGTRTKDAQTFLIKILGRHAPTLSHSITTGDNVVTEDDTGDATVTGTLTFGGDEDKATFDVYVAAGRGASDASTEVEVGEGASDSSVEVLGTYGAFVATRTSSGDITWVYTLDHTNSDIQALHHGEEVTDQLAVIVYDVDRLKSDVETITVRIVGASDRPVLDPVTGATIMDNVAPDTGSDVTTGSLTGTFTLTDIDVGDTHMYTASFGGVDATALDAPQNGYTYSIEGTYGDLFFYGRNVTDASARYEYVRKEAEINKLDDGDRASDTFEIAVVDQHDENALPSEPRNLVFNLIGVNDAPTSSITSGPARVNHDEIGTIPMSISFFDIDSTDPNSSLTIRVFDSIGMTFDSSTGIPQTPLYNADSPHVISGGAMSSVPSTYGTFNITRNDNDGSIGEISITYDLNEANTDVQNLNLGANLYDKLTVYVNDGDDTSSAQTVVVAIVNPSVPTLSHSITGDNDVTEDDTGDATVAGTLTFDDADDGQNKSTLKVYVAAGEDATDTSSEVRVDSSNDVEVAGTYGAFVLTRTSLGDITWVYELEHGKDETQALGHDERATDQLAVIVYDADGLKSNVEIITVNITGVNDRPVLGALPDVTITDNPGFRTGNVVTPNDSLTSRFTVTDPDDDIHTFHVTFRGIDAVQNMSRPEFTHSFGSLYGGLFYNAKSHVDMDSDPNTPPTPNPDAGRYEYIFDQYYLDRINSPVTFTYKVSVSDGSQTNAVSEIKTLRFTSIGSGEATQPPEQPQPQQGVEPYLDDTYEDPSDDIPPLTPDMI